MNIYEVNKEGVINELTNPTVIEKLLEKLFNLGYELGIKILTCVLVYYIGKFIIRWIDKVILRILTKREIDQSVKTFLESLINIILTILLIMTIIGILGVQTTSFAALIASAGLAVGMAMKDNLGNFAGGVMILFNKPFKVGDYISAQNQEGSVKSINILYTILTTIDNKTIFIPNGPLSTGNILNYSMQNERRVDLTVGVDYGISIANVKEILKEIISENPNIFKTPEPFIGVIKLNNSTVDFIIRVWVKSSDYWPVYFYLNESIYEKFNKNNINLPFPQMTVHLSNHNKSN